MISIIYTVVVFIIMILPMIDTGVRMVIADVMLSIFSLVTLTVSTATAIRFYKLKRQKHTINFNTCTLVTTLLFNLSFVASEILTYLLQTEVNFFHNNSNLTTDEFEEHMSKLNTRDIIYVSTYFVLQVCLSTLAYNLYRNIEQFSPESKKVHLDELVQKYDCDEHLLTESDTGSGNSINQISRHQRHDSLYRFNQFYKHYMKHLLDEMSREENEVPVNHPSTSIHHMSGRPNLDNTGGQMYQDSLHEIEEDERGEGDDFDLD